MSDHIFNEINSKYGLKPMSYSKLTPSGLSSSLGPIKSNNKQTNEIMYYILLVAFASLISFYTMKNTPPQCVLYDDDDEDDKFDSSKAMLMSIIFGILIAVLTYGAMKLNK
jgi:hypothetical protein